MKKYVTLVNSESGQEYRVRLCKSFLVRLKGYMFQKEPSEAALLLDPCDSIHMFGMKFPLDVLFLNKKYQIIKRIDNLQPRKVVLPVRGAKIVIEAPVGTLTGLREGMFLVRQE